MFVCLPWIVWRLQSPNHYDDWSISALDVGSTSIYSVKCPQFTGLPSTWIELGYWMCARLYLNGDGMGRTTPAFVLCYHERRLWRAVDIAVQEIKYRGKFQCLYEVFANRMGKVGREQPQEAGVDKMWHHEFLVTLIVSIYLTSRMFNGTFQTGCIKAPLH